MNKTVFVTGATGGLGKAICETFHRNGWTIFATSTSETKLENLKSLYPGIRGTICDLKSQDSITKAFATALSEVEHIDVLINNAAVKSKCPIEEIKDAEISDVFQVNVESVFFLTRKIVEHMKKENGFGRIINVSSTLGLMTTENFSLYGATKFALTGFSKSLMREVLKDNILVSTIYPGGINTPFHSEPRPQYLKAEDVANSIFFIASQPDDVLISELVIVPKTDNRIP